MLIANFDISSIKIEGDKKQEYLKKLFQKCNVEYNARKKLLYCEGGREVAFGLMYQGADDKAGPNYTGAECSGFLLYKL
ncbi:hypothetical protein HNQ91_004721 [Filimonas zeae]|uniref:Uncharacterized protein n=1 Tax=Filimonas zeae TaxID=1737353 RepID=A0A917J2I1_9BACT|nr:hypothetical protein [Filimonas zeae]GGH74832.1 hypothetical protein GCM10011379_37810 [Filimonas zeae]